MKQPMHIDNNAAGLPEESIWLAMPYGGQTEWVKEKHLARMRQHKFSRPDVVLAVGPSEETAGAKLNRAKRNQGGYVTLGMAI